MLPQDAELGDAHTPRELLVHHGRLQRASRRIGTLSHGMRRRVAVASALVGEPALVLLDEPTAGLDPVQACSLREAFVRRRPGQTLVVSSHDLHELERICDWVVMIDRGRLLRQGALAEVAGTGETVLWRRGPGEVPLQRLRAALPDHRWRVEDGVLGQTAPMGTISTARPWRWPVCWPKPASRSGSCGVGWGSSGGSSRIGRRVLPETQFLRSLPGWYAASPESP